jgi:hypothetical protein
MTVCAVLASLIPIPVGEWHRLGRDEADCRAPSVSGVFVLMKERALRRGTLRPEPAE